LKRPQDPRHHGLKEPKKILSKKGEHILSRHGDNISLVSIIAIWNRMVDDHSSQEARIVEGPHIRVDGYDITLFYRYEWDNHNYAAEKAEFDLAIATYDIDVAKFKKQEEEIKTSPPDLSQKIERAKQRLANLEATQAGQPLPYPDM